MISIWRSDKSRQIPRVGDQDKLTKGPVVDTAASISVVNKRDSKHLRNKYKLHKPEEIKSATGTTTVTKAGEMTVGGSACKLPLPQPGLRRPVVLAPY